MVTKVYWLSVSSAILPDSCAFVSAVDKSVYIQLVTPN